MRRRTQSIIVAAGLDNAGCHTVGDLLLAGRALADGVGERAA